MEMESRSVEGFKKTHPLEESLQAHPTGIIHGGEGLSTRLKYSAGEEYGTFQSHVSAVQTPTKTDSQPRQIGVERYGNGETYSYQRTRLRAPPHHTRNAPGPETLDHKYMPFAAGFAHMASEASVYRTARLHMINPTAAVSDDISFYYSLDSGRVPPAAIAANPESSAEFVRNTAVQTHGGFFKRMMKPIE